MSSDNEYDSSEVENVGSKGLHNSINCVIKFAEKFDWIAWLLTESIFSISECL